MTEQYCPCRLTFLYLPVMYRNCILTVSQKYDLHICNSCRIITLIYKNIFIDLPLKAPSNPNHSIILLSRWLLVIKLLCMRE